MSAKYRRQVFEPSCPAGGEFYACDYGSRFVGCCTVEPCVNGCAETQLKPASFLKEKYKDVTGALCPGESNWWTCAGTTPPFLGCCKSNPCTQNGCPSKDLMAAILSPARSEALPYSPIANPSLTASTVSSSVSTASLSTATLLPSTARLPTATPLPSESTPLSTKTRTLGGIIGGAVGGGFLLVLVCVVFFLYRRRKATKTSSPKIPYSGINLSKLRCSVQTNKHIRAARPICPHGLPKLSFGS